LKNERQSNTKAGTIAQRSCLCGGGFKHSCAMVGSSGNDHSIVVDRGDHFGCHWPLFSLLILQKLHRTGWQARLAGILRKHRDLFFTGTYFLPRQLAKMKEAEGGCVPSSGLQAPCALDQEQQTHQQQGADSAHLEEHFILHIPSSGFSSNKPSWHLPCP
jgi:hypothetical protein